MDIGRTERLKRFFRCVNQQRRQQKKKIDILCNDIIAAQRTFVDKLSHYNFVLDFYESIIGQTNIKKLIDIAGQKIKNSLSNYEIGIYCLEKGCFEYLSQKDNSLIESFFSPLISQKISKTNTVLSVDEIALLGGDCESEIFKKIDFCSVPISGYGSAMGFVLIWANLPNKISPQCISKMQSICPSLAKAFRSCGQLKYDKCKVGS